MKFGASVLMGALTQAIPELSRTVMCFSSHGSFMWDTQGSSSAVAWPETEEKHKRWAESRQRRMMLCPSPPCQIPAGSCGLLDHPRAFLHSLTHGQGQQWGLLLSAKLFPGCIRCPGQDQGWGPRFLYSLMSAVPQQPFEKVTGLITQ